MRTKYVNWVDYLLNRHGSNALWLVCSKNLLDDKATEIMYHHIGWKNNEIGRSDKQAGQKESDTFCEKFILVNKGKIIVRRLHRMKLSAVIPVVNWSFSGVAGPSEKKDFL